jgi:hypothetical protein
LVMEDRWEKGLKIRKIQCLRFEVK